MSRIDPVWATVAELSHAFGERRLSPVDAVEALLERIRKRDALLHAYIAAGVAFLTFAVPAARAQQRHAPLVRDSSPVVQVDWTRIGIVAAVLIAALDGDRDAILADLGMEA